MHTSQTLSILYTSLHSHGTPHNLQREMKMKMKKKKESHKSASANHHLKLCNAKLNPSEQTLEISAITGVPGNKIIRVLNLIRQVAKVESYVPLTGSQFMVSILLSCRWCVFQDLLFECPAWSTFLYV